MYDFAPAKVNRYLVNNLPTWLVDNLPVDLHIPDIHCEIIHQSS